MYLPILRGRQFELIALRECVRQDLIGDRVLPIIEPVKLNPNLVKSMEQIAGCDYSIAVVRNPIVGTFDKDCLDKKNAKLNQQFNNLIERKNFFLPAYYVDSDTLGIIQRDADKGINIQDMVLMCDSVDKADYCNQIIKKYSPNMILMPDRAGFRRRIESDRRVIWNDDFPKKPRNIDYLENEEDLFSCSHLDYVLDGYIGFSDYSIVGNEYSESGFAPYAVAIHIVFFDEQDNLKIAHFVSDTNDDITYPAIKFEEEVGKLVKWNHNRGENGLRTVGIKLFEDAYKNGSYPGLGVVKKYSIMHHLELMNQFLKGE